MRHIRQDSDVKEMRIHQLRQEVMILRHAIRKHKKAEGNARCWHNDKDLYIQTLPEGDEGMGSMLQNVRYLLRMCKQYILGQQCRAAGCTGPSEPAPTLIQLRKQL